VWKQHVVAAYHVSDPQAYGGCQAVAGTQAQQEMVVTSAEENYKRLGAEVVHVNWTSAPGQTLTAPTPQPALTHDAVEPTKSTSAPASPAQPAAVAAIPTPAATPPVSSAHSPGAAPAAGSTGTSASAQPFNTICRYQGLQDGHQIVYVTPVIHTDLNAYDISVAFNRYMSATYDISKIQAGSGYCSTKVSNSADQQAYTMQQLEKQWADSKTVVTHLNWTGTPDEIQAVNAKSAAAAAAAPANPNEKYVYCFSGVTGPVVYFSDIFAAVPTSPTVGPHAGRNGFPEFSGPFLAFLQNKYGYKSDPSSPITCRAMYNPIPAGLQAAQATRQAAQDLNRQANKQIVETGWRGQ